MYLKKLLSTTLVLLLVSGCAFSVCPGVNFQRAKTTQLNAPLRSAIYMDLDNDGIKDLFGDTSGGLHTGFYKGLPDGFNPTPVDNYDASNFVLQINKNAVADFNNDGYPDLLAVSTGVVPLIPSVAIYLNDHNGRFAQSTITTGTTGNEEERIITAVADINSDGRPDLITRSGGSVGFTYYRLIDATNHFGPPVPMAGDVKNLLVKDMNGDGLNDLIYTFQQNGPSEVRYMINQGNGTYSGAARSIPRRLHDGTTVFADVNNDGRVEMITAAYYTTQPLTIQYSFSVFQFTAKGTITETVTDLSGALHRTLAEAGQGFSSQPQAADFDGDGLTDVMFFSIGTGAVLAKNDGALNFTAGRYGPVGNYTPFLTEFSGDNRPDLVTINTNFATVLNYSVSLKKNVCAPVGQNRIVDFDGNGQSDIVFWNPNDGRWLVYGGQGYTGINNNVSWGSGALGDIPVPQDYDGDGFTDLAVYRAPTGYWYIYQSSDGQVVIRQFGLSGDKPAPADLDGDGRAELTVFRPSDGNWYYLPTTAPEKLVGIHWGLSGDIPLPMDYNGDGVADIAIYRPSNGQWYIWMTNNGSVYSTTFGGSANDRPMPGDYDDDGAANLAIWRPTASNNGINWFVAIGQDLWGYQLGVLGDSAFPSASLSARPAIYHPADSSIRFASFSFFTFNVPAGSKNVSWILPID